MSSSPNAAYGDDDSFYRRNLPTLGAWLGNLGWPILLKQLRTEFRKNRFFYSHFVCLAVLGGALLLTITTMASDVNITPTQVGQQIFGRFLFIQFFIVVLIFPVFSATAFTEERSNLSLDLLLITTLSPEEIVWGKFLASSFYCLLYIMATLPLLAISFLFGGITLGDVAAAYAFLIALTLLVSMLSLCVSSCFSSNTRATLTVYILVFLGLLGFYYLVLDDVESALSGQSYLTTVTSLWSSGTSLPWLGAMLFFLDLGAIFTLLFLVTTNRIRPRADDHSSKLRFLAFVYVPLRLIGGFYNTFGELVDSFALPSADRIAQEMEWIIICTAPALLFLTLVFSTEEATVSPRCRRRFLEFTSLRYPGRLFAPGGFWGLAYSLLLSVAACGLLLALFELHLAAAARAETVHLVREALVTLPVYLAVFGALGFLLSVLSFTPLYSRLTVSFIFIISLLLPVIFYISQQSGDDKAYYLYYISPLVLWQSLDFIDVVPASDEVQFRLLGIHIVDIAKVVFALAFVTLGALALRLAKRSGLPLLRFR